MTVICRARVSDSLRGGSSAYDDISMLPLPVDKCLHQPLRLAGQERLPEYADAEVDGFLQRQLLPLPEQGFLRAQRFRSAFQQGLDRLLDRGIEAALRRDHVDQAA